MSHAKVKHKKSVIVLAWLAPIIAILVSANMLYENFKDLGQSVILNCQDISPLDERKSRIRFKGLEIGKISSLALDESNISNFKVKIHIYKQFTHLLKEGSRFWIVEPKISLSGISDARNVVMGNYIHFEPPRTQNIDLLKAKWIFTLHLNAPEEEGRTIKLIAKRSHLGVGSDIVYKGVEVGEVVTTRLQNKEVEHEVLLYKPYLYLFNAKTEFYQKSAIKFKASLEELSVDISSINEILSAQISFVSHDDNSTLKERYTLHESHDDILLDAHKIEVSAKGYHSFKYLYLKTLKVAKVIDTRYDVQKDRSTFSVRFYPPYYSLLSHNPHFIITKPTLSFKDPNLKSLISTDKLTLRIDRNKHTTIEVMCQPYIIHII